MSKIPNYYMNMSCSNPRDRSEQLVQKVAQESNERNMRFAQFVTSQSGGSS